MGLPVLIMGRSGTGKTASLRNLKEPTFVVNVNKKPLSFKKNENIKIYDCDEYLKIKESLKLAYEKGYKIAVIDDAGYLMTSKFMLGHRQAKGSSQFDLYNEIADNFYSLIRFVSDSLPKDIIVYIVMHEEVNDLGLSKPKSIGKLLDEKVCIEGMFTIVLRSLKVDNKYVFATNTDGLDVTKSPIGMFEQIYIDNDLQVVNDTIKGFYKED